MRNPSRRSTTRPTLSSSVVKTSKPSISPPLVNSQRRNRYTSRFVAAREVTLLGWPDGRGGRGGGGPDAGDLRPRLPELGAVPAGHEPARLAAPDPDEPQHRPRPARAASP